MQNVTLKQKTLLEERRPKLVKGLLIIFNGYGNMVRVLDPLKMAVQFFIYDKDALFEINGFNWEPEEPYYKRAMEIVERNNQEEIKKALSLPDVEISKVNGIGREQAELRI